MINDEQLIAALVSAGSVRTAATAAGVSESTIRNRLRDPDFRAAFESVKSELLQGATAAMVSRLENATNTLSEVLSDVENPASVRVSAASVLLQHALRYLSAADFERRISALKASQAALEGDENNV